MKLNATTAAMSTSGTGMRPAAPDHSDKRSTKCDASSSRGLSVISAAARPVGTPASVPSFRLPQIQSSPVPSVESSCLPVVSVDQIY